MTFGADPGPRPLVALVDSDAAVGDALTFQLELEGYEVVAYRDAASVLACPPVNRPGCLVIDLDLPDMDGVVLLRRLRDQGVTLPAVLIVGQPTGAARGGIAAQTASIVEKPLLNDDLAEAVARAVRTASGSV